MEFPGGDHFVQTGEGVDEWLAAVQTFTIGELVPPRLRTRRGHTRPRAVTTIRTLNGFAVVIGDQEVPIAAWGSRRARQLCKMLAAARGQPLRREHLIDVLWPDGAVSDRLGARLSVQLSAVRRILGGGIVADRDWVRLDLTEVRLDIEELHRVADAGDPAAVVTAYAGEFLPEDPYEEWAAPPRDHARRVYVRALHALAEQAAATGDQEAVTGYAARIVLADQFDETGHQRLIAALARAGHLGEARSAWATYEVCMNELDVPCAAFDSLVAPSG
jgi:DNA-binding SARP family transcriptional activator